jgi:hypothetical protein
LGYILKDYNPSRFFRRVGNHIGLTRISHHKGTNFLIKVPNIFKNIFHGHCPFFSAPAVQEKLTSDYNTCAVPNGNLKILQNT